MSSTGTCKLLLPVLLQVSHNLEDLPREECGTDADDDGPVAWCHQLQEGNCCMQDAVWFKVHSLLRVDLLSQGRLAAHDLIAAWLHRTPCSHRCGLQR
jgi:hypothetical protein